MRIRVRVMVRLVFSWRCYTSHMAPFGSCTNCHCVQLLGLELRVNVVNIIRFHLCPFAFSHFICYVVFT